MHSVILVSGYCKFLCRQVVWRRTKEDYPLTIGKMTFSQEDEMSVQHTELSRTSSSWDLLIKNVKPKHAGVYECQISANHLIAQYVYLNVIGKCHILLQCTLFDLSLIQNQIECIVWNTCTKIFHNTLCTILGSWNFTCLLKFYEFFGALNVSLTTDTMDAGRP